MGEKIKTPTLERLTKKIIFNSKGCWEWIGCVNYRGYGVFKVEQKSQLVHRVSYQLLKGIIPNGLELDHLCRNRICINPHHLEAVTHKENLRRGLNGFIGALKQRLKTHCPKGHEYTKENTRIHISKKNQKSRLCKTCDREVHNRRYALGYR